MLTVSSNYDSSACLKVRLSPSKKVIFTFFNESPLKSIENTFYFILKVLFVFKSASKGRSPLKILKKKAVFA